MQISFEIRRFVSTVRFDSTLSIQRAYELQRYGGQLSLSSYRFFFFFFFHLFHIGIDINESSSSLSLYRVEGIFSFLGGNFNQFSIVKKKKRMLFNSEERINQNLGYSLKKYESVLFFFFGGGN